MPKSYLWCLDKEGFVYYLSTWDKSWTKLDSPLSKIQIFHSVCASSWCLWAIGYDKEIYIYVYKSDASIRVLETITQNQRKKNGIYSGQNLRNDDPPEFIYYDIYGKMHKTDMKNYKLPSTRWTWEEDWRVKRAYEGFIAHDDGWLYGSSFQLRTNQMEPQRSRLTMNGIRRRTWQRYRYFSAIERWLLIGHHNEETFNVLCGQQDLNVSLDTPEVTLPSDLKQLSFDDDNSSSTSVASRTNEKAFISLACGGEYLPHQKDGFVSIWAINSDGQVMYRLNVNRLAPEGQNWCYIHLPNQIKAKGISVGPLGHVMVTTKNKMILFRDGISWKNPIGSSWCQVDSPKDFLDSEEIKDIQISIYSIWLLSGHRRLWMRDNVNLHSQECMRAIGNHWVQFPAAADLTSISTASPYLLFGLTGMFGVVYKQTNKIKYSDRMFWTDSIPQVFDKDNKERFEDLVGICATGLLLNNSNIPEAWQNFTSFACKIDIKTYIECRNNILDALNDRDYREYKDPNFAGYTAITEQVSWSKSAACNACSTSTELPTNPRWVSVDVTIYQKILDNFCDKATLHLVTRSLEQKTNKDLISFVDCQDIICISKFDMGSNENCGGQCNILLILNVSKTTFKQSIHHTLNLPRLLLKFKSEAEVEDWILALYMIKQSIYKRDNTNNKANNASSSKKYEADKTNGNDAGKLWFLNQFHEPHVSNCYVDSRQEIQYKWNMHGGHFCIVESGLSGAITWALGYNGSVYIHNNYGYGGSYLNILCSSRPEHLQVIEDQRSLTVIEYEHMNKVAGMKLTSWAPFKCVDYKCAIVPSKDNVSLSSKRWKWDGDWVIDYQMEDGTATASPSAEITEPNVETGLSSYVGNVDEDGWQYSSGITQKYDSKSAWNKNYRRRFWTRSYRTSVVGPWLEVVLESIKIIDVSIAPSATTIARMNTEGTKTFTYRPFPQKDNFDPNCVVWAVSNEGDLFRRTAVTVSCPEGRDWHRVKAPTKMYSVSINSQYTLWTVCGNGHLWRLDCAANLNVNGNKSIFSNTNASLSLSSVSSNSTIGNNKQSASTSSSKIFNFSPQSSTSTSAASTGNNPSSFPIEDNWAVVRHDSPYRKFIKCTSGDNQSLWAVDDHYDLWCREFPQPGVSKWPTPLAHIEDSSRLHDSSTSSNNTSPVTSASSSTNTTSTALIIANSPSHSGSSWIYVCHKVMHVSCRSFKKLWGVFHNGDVAERTGISLTSRSGSSWNYRLRDVGTYVCSRGGSF